ncbi:O-antigen ligase family protein [Bacillus alkalisoli]|uniref:O-antigen ligase family protein n=1 Tax=Bacillus alkalisoli TaxID=2011008 RepID=UPI000C247426|nr:O-antigen ligase family protein [Bacillus alkalisoli]
MGIKEVFSRLKDNSNQLLLIFIIFQPILDILTAFNIYYLGTSITVGLLVRMAFLLFGLLFILLFSESHLKRPIGVYLLFLLSVVGIGFIGNFFSKPVFNIFYEVQFVAKALYFVVMFLSYLLIFTTLHTHKVFVTKFQQYVVYAMTIVGAVLLFTFVTGTGFNTYEYGKAGNKGWFYSGNELSAILSIGFPFVIMYAVRKMNAWKEIYYWLPALTLGFSALMLGTKVGHLSILLVCGLTPIILLIEWLKSAKLKEDTKAIKRNLIVSISAILLFILLTPITPAYTNTAGHYTSVNEKLLEELLEEMEGENEIDNKELEENNALKEKMAENKFFKNKLVTVLLSNRDVYLYRTHTHFVAAPIHQKLFGLGYAGNWEDHPKLIEMDFFDLFYSFGIIGFILFIAPFVITVYLLVKNLFVLKYKMLRADVLFPLVSLALAIGAATIAGHVLYAPAVSIYVAAILAYLLNHSNKIEN